MMSAIQLVLVLIVVVTIALFVLYIYIVLSSKKVKKQQLHYHAYLNEQEHNWHTYLLDETAIMPSMIPQNEGQFLAVEYICSTYLRLLSDESIQTRISHFAEKYLKERYKTQLMSKMWSTRMNALRYIGLFDIDSLVASSQQLLTTKIKADERFEIIQLFALQDSTALMEIIQNESLHRNEYRRLFMSLSPHTLLEVFKQFAYLPDIAQRIAVQVAAERRDPMFLPYVDTLLQDEESELRIGGLKIVYELGASLPIESLSPFVTATSYVERLYAVRNLNFTPMYQAIPYLETLISDENWYVRQEVAYVLYQHEEGRTVLGGIIANSTDPYAVDIAKQVLQKEGALHD